MVIKHIFFWLSSVLQKRTIRRFGSNFSIWLDWSLGVSYDNNGATQYNPKNQEERERNAHTYGVCIAYLQTLALIHMYLIHTKMLTTWQWA